MFYSTNPFFQFRKMPTRMFPYQAFEIYDWCYIIVMLCFIIHSVFNYYKVVNWVNVSMIVLLWRHEPRFGVDAFCSALHLPRPHTDAQWMTLVRFLCSCLYIVSRLLSTDLVGQAFVLIYSVKCTRVYLCSVGEWFKRLFWYRLWSTRGSIYVA